MKKFTLFSILVILLSILLSGCVNSSTPAEDFSYKISNNTVIIKGYLGSKENISIPEKIEDKWVVQIDNEAFYKNKTLKTIDIPDSVTFIDEYAFGDCENLIEVKLPEKLKEIGAFAFCGCTSINNIEIPENVTYIYRGAFKECRNLENITMSDELFNKLNDYYSSIKDEYEGIFYGCSNVKVNGSPIT